MKKIFLLLVISVFCGFNIYAQSFVPKSDTAITALGKQLSAAVDLNGYKVFTVKIASTFDGDSIAIYQSEDTTSANFNPVYDLDTDTILKFKVTAGREYRFIPSDNFFYKRYIKIWSNSAATTTPDISIVTKGLY